MTESTAVTQYSAEESPKSRTLPRWNRYLHRILGAEISSAARYYDQVVQLRTRVEDHGFLVEAIEGPDRTSITTVDEIPLQSAESFHRLAVILNGNLNHSLDIQADLAKILPRLNRYSRLFVVAYNPYLSWLYRIANALGLRKGEVPSTFLTRTDLKNVTKLAGFEIVRERPTVFFPFQIPLLATVLNRCMPLLPGARILSLASVFILRPRLASPKRPSLSVVIPARNERGNIENALKRMPDLGCDLEVIFVEGHSGDGTWEEIQRVVAVYGDRFKLQAHRQTGKGKNDAVRLGFAHARNDLLTILDADLTMPPELLGRFYEAYVEGKSDFINGTRLVYPMEGKAMRPLNRLGNIFFAKALSAVLGVRLGDSLCGTKLVSRRDYDRIIAWRKDFGDFDPFGDFELLFPAAILGMGITDVPIRYRDRTYGTTNISRFRHGAMLLKMTIIGFLRIRSGQ